MNCLLKMDYLPTERIEYLPNIVVAVISDDGKTVIKEQKSLAAFLVCPEFVI